MSLVKPQLRGLLKSYVKKNCVAAFTVSLSCVLYYHYMVRAPRKQAYADFYKTYDVDADFERMKKTGVFQSVKPTGDIGS